MPLALTLSLVLTIGSIVLSLLFKVSGKLRLTIPLVYLILVSTIFSSWSSENETLAIGILVALVVLSIGSWFISLVKFISRKRQTKFTGGDMKYQLQKAREMGIDTNQLSFDNDNELIYSNTKERVFK